MSEVFSTLGKTNPFSVMSPSYAQQLSAFIGPCQTAIFGSCQRTEAHATKSTALIAIERSQTNLQFMLELCKLGLQFWIAALHVDGCGRFLLNGAELRCPRGLVRVQGGLRVSQLVSSIGVWRIDTADGVESV